MTELRAVLWDLDGTILDTEKLWHDAVGEYVAEHGGYQMTDEDRHSLTGASVSQVLHTMLRLCGREPSAPALREADDWINDRLAARYAGPPRWRPGAEAALRTVRAAHLRSALVTNTGRPLADLAMAAIGRDYFDVSVTGDDVRRAKPAPDPFARGAELLGVSPAECVAIEDSATGAAAATAAGCGVLIVPCDVAITRTLAGRLRQSLACLTISDLQAVLN